MSALTVVSPSTGVADVLSPSQISTWRDCQARWSFHYLLGLPDMGSPSLALGTAVHAAIGATWHRKLETGIDLSVAQTIEIYAAKWREESGKVEFGAKQDKDEMAMQGARMVEIYMAQAEPSIHPQAVDYEVTGTIAGVYVRGYIDLVTAEGMIVDLKTAATTPKAIKPNHGFQIATYAQLAQNLDLSGKARVDTLVKLKTPKLVQIEHEVALPDYHLLRSTYPLAQEQMRTGLYLPNRDSYLCKRATCAYWRQCEAEYGGCVQGGADDAEC